MLSRRLFTAIEKRVYSIKMNHVWTADNIVKSPCKDIIIPEITLSEYVWRNLEKWSDKTALIDERLRPKIVTSKDVLPYEVCGITDRKYSYLQLHQKTEIFGASLRKKFKIENGDVVSIMLPNSPEYMIAVFGILAAGGIVSTINPVYTTYEIQKQISSSEPKLIITNPENVVTVKEALKLSKSKAIVITVDIDKDRPDETVSFKELINDIHIDKSILKEVSKSNQDTALLLYSSGTTGLPKAVECTHRNIVSNNEQQIIDSYKKYNDTTESNQDVNLAYLPMFHCYGLSMVCIQKLAAGLKSVTLPRFLPETFLNTLERHKFTNMFLAPPTVLFLASNPQVKTKHFEKLQYVIVGAAPLPQADVERFLNKVNHEINFGQGYGLTEASPLVTIAPNHSKNYTSAGPAVPNVELRIIDNNMNNLGPNELGELLIKGPNVMKGYKNNPEANSQVFIDEWLRSGDFAKIDEAGVLTIADRLKELIKVNAFQVPPAELESVIREHPAVSDAAVVGVPDDKTGEKPKAFVTINKGFDVSEKDIMQYVSERVSPYKRLKEVQFIDVIPKNTSGKILRRVLAEESKKK